MATERRRRLPCSSKRLAVMVAIRLACRTHDAAAWWEHAADGGYGQRWQSIRDCRLTSVWQQSSRFESCPHYLSCDR